MKIGDIVTRTLLGLVLLPFRTIVEPRLMATRPARSKAPEPAPSPIAPRR
jgi:hypothetical protein